MDSKVTATASRTARLHGDIVGLLLSRFHPLRVSGVFVTPPTLVLILPDRTATAREASTPMDFAATRERATATFQRRREQAKDLVDRIPILGRLLSEVVRV